MAKRNSGNQDFTPNADGFDMTSGTTPRKLTLTGGDVTITGAASGGLTYSFPTQSNYTRLIGSNGGDNALFTNDVGTYATTVTAAGTTILTVASPKRQYFTGTTTQICRLPVATTLELGTTYEIVNESTGLVTINEGDGTDFTPPLTVPSQSILSITCTNIGTTQGVWGYHIKSMEGINLGTQYIITNTNRSLTSQTAAQKIFAVTSGSGILGAFPVVTGYQYIFECFVHLTGLSGTSGTFGFAIGLSGAVIATNGLKWTSTASKITNLATQTAVFSTFNTAAANTNLTPNTTFTAGMMMIKGVVSFSTAGNIIPSVSLSTAAAATVNVGSYFKIERLTPTTVASSLAWL